MTKHRYIIESTSPHDLEPYFKAIDNSCIIEECDDYLRNEFKHGTWPENVCDMIERAREILRGV